MSKPSIDPVATAAHNKQLLQAAFADVARGDRARFRALYADDVVWTTIGSTAWSKPYVGKPAIVDMFARLAGLLEALPAITTTRFIADGDVVAVEARGVATSKAGKPYNNTYCLVYRFAGGQIKEITEYCDTALIDAVL